MHRRLDLAIESGTVFQDRYKIVEELSSGGFGVVFKAEQLTTGQAVAIKCLQRRGHTPDEDQKILARFHRETRLCAQLHHPNIVRLMDSGQSQGGILYSVFEYVPGRNLKQILADEGRLGPAETKHLMGQVLDALSCAHAQGIIHRDLKPANIMVVPTGARRNALVLDFGIGALIQEMRDADYDDLTTTMGRVGTPAYSSPEQLRGEEVSPATDIYSFGLVFLECLTGARAIRARSSAEIMHKQLSTDPVPLPYGLKGHPLDAFLRMATAKNPAHRRITASQLLAQLDACDMTGLDEVFRDSRGAALQEPDDASTLAIQIADRATRELGDSSRSGTSLSLAFGPTPWFPGEQSDSSTSGSGAAQSPALPGHGERRQVTVVSLCLSVLTSGESPMDIEEHEELLHAQVEHFTELASRMECHVAGEFDDRVVLCFGYPRAHGDDARRAVTAALRMLGELEGGSDRAPGVELQIGVHTGMVLIRSRRGGQPKISGQPMRIATRLAQSVAPGTVAVTAETHKLLRSDFAFQPLPARSLTSDATPMEIFRVKGEARGEDVSPPSLPTDTGPFVGRRSDVLRLMEQWRAARGGHGRAVLVTGDVGVGKSRLLRELTRALGDEPLSWLECRCLQEDRNSTLRPVVEMLERYLDLHVDGRAGAGARLQDLLHRHGLDPAQAMPLLAPLLSVPAGDHPLPDVSPQRLRELTLSALMSLLVEVAAARPTLLIIDDLQWADATTLELVGLILGEIDSIPLLLVATARSDFQPPWATSAMMLTRLDPLHPGSVAELVTGLARKPVPAAVLDEVVRRTDGVPLFVEEMVRALVESGALVEGETEYTLRGSVADLEIPATLRDLLTARLDRLGDDARAVVQLASVMGREFSQTLLQAVCWLDEPRLRACMDQLVASGLLQRRRRLHGETYVFKHILVRDTAYESLPRSDRQRYHGHIAATMEASMAEPGAVRPERLALHWAGAGETVRALEHARRAAMEALQTSANVEAIGYAEQAISWLGGIADEIERAESELSFYAIIFPARLGAGGQGQADFGLMAQRAQELIGRVGDSPFAFSALWGLWIHQYVRSEYQKALVHAEDYVRRTERLGDPSQRVLAYSLLSPILFYMGRLAATRESCERFLAMHDPERDQSHIFLVGFDTKAVQLGILAQTLWFMGQPDRARALAEEGLERARALGHPLSVAFGLFFLGPIVQWGGDGQRYCELAGELALLAERHGLLQWTTLAQLFIAAAHGDAEHGHRALEQFRATGQSIGLTFWLGTLAESEAGRGNVSRALSLAAEAVAMAEAEAGDERYHLARLYCLRGDYHVQAPEPDPTAAETSYRSAIAVARDQGARMFELMALTRLCALLRPADRHRDTSLALHAVYASLTEGFAVPEVARARALLADLDMLPER